MVGERSAAMVTDLANLGNGELLREAAVNCVRESDESESPTENGRLWFISKLYMYMKLYIDLLHCYLFSMQVHRNA